ncbi:hypothetical protein SAMN05192560_0794 [Methylobacillus rhizosphaerae]|uniref:Uncharacterized protein n=1 Tax=Methylobacillus rhizosphaerae TaxID=551994 RepID=A0A238YT27_9PROT|nr:hypothetical protein [Methylobacillus rhizosphaerae]SNR73968.1 hypothetical protein SAMN05192560_0794 [Methylobacillus rhizosphaerae]
MNLSGTQPFTVGRYLITPISRAAESGRYISSISISSGKGTASHCRIFSFSREFKTREKALLHAAEQGQRWLANPLAFA